MGACNSKISRRQRAARAGGSRSAPERAERGAVSNNSNTNYMLGSGTINNHNLVTNNFYARPPTPPAHASDVSVSAMLPPKPTVFHGRDNLVDEGVRTLTARGTARLAILGSGGMGKTSVALALLHSTEVVELYGDGRLFLSCEALVDADAVVVSLAKILGLPASGDLLTAVVSHLNAMSRVVLVLDNFETVWLTGGAPAAAVEELLGRLAQIPSLSLIITCRGNDLPQSVEWSNADNAALEPFSLEAALRTFQDRAGRRIAVTDEEVSKQLLNAVDRMPLAVSLLGQLARRGNSVPELLDRWNRERTMLLQTHKRGRINNVQISIEISIKMLREADDSGEALQLLSLCCLLPDGLHPEVFKQLRPKFKHIERARDDLFAFALVNVGADRVLKTLSPIRHLVSMRHPAQPSRYAALCSIYIDIARQLPVKVDGHFREHMAVAAPEMNNLPSLLITMVSQPTQQVVDSVVSFTRFANLQRPNATVAFALLPYLERYPEWKADCLESIGNAQFQFNDYTCAIQSFFTAARLFLEANNLSRAAWCQRATGTTLAMLGRYSQGEGLINKAREIYLELGHELDVARCSFNLGGIMRQACDYPAAIEHLSSARQTFESLGETFEAAKCSEIIGLVYHRQGRLACAAAELEGAYSVFASLGNQIHMAQSRHFLGAVHRQKGEHVLSEKLLREAEGLYRECGNKPGLAESAYQFALLRKDQGRREESIARFNSACSLFEDLRKPNEALICRRHIDELE